MKRALLLLFLSGSLYGQATFVSEYFYDGNGNTRYSCQAPANLPFTFTTPNSGTSTSIQPAPVLSIAAGSLTSIVVSSGVATVTVASTSVWNAGTYADMTVYVSGSATPAVNGTAVVTSGNTNTTTFTYSTGASNGTYTDTALKITAVNPLLTLNAWNLTVYTYNGSNQVTGSIAVNQNYSIACAARSSY